MALPISLFQNDFLCYISSFRSSTVLSLHLPRVQHHFLLSPSYAGRSCWLLTIPPILSSTLFYRHEYCLNPLSTAHREWRRSSSPVRASMSCRTHQVLNYLIPMMQQSRSQWLQCQFPAQLAPVKPLVIPGTFPTNHLQALPVK